MKTNGALIKSFDALKAMAGTKLLPTGKHGIPNLAPKRDCSYSNKNVSVMEAKGRMSHPFPPAKEMAAQGRAAAPGARNESATTVEYADMLALSASAGLKNRHCPLHYPKHCPHWCLAAGVRLPLHPVIKQQKYAVVCLFVCFFLTSARREGW
jgi:hypothetical protein